MGPDSKSFKWHARCIIFYYTLLTRYWLNSGTTDCYRHKLHPAISQQSSFYPRRCCGNDASPSLRGPCRRRLRRTRRPPACRYHRCDGLPPTDNQCLCRRDTTMTTTTTMASCHRRTSSSRLCCSAIITRIFVLTSPMKGQF